MNSEYHKLPVSKTKKRIYNEDREVKKPLHIEGGSSSTDAERLSERKVVLENVIRLSKDQNKMLTRLYDFVELIVKERHNP